MQHNILRNEALGIILEVSYQHPFVNSDITVTPVININNIFDERYNGSTVVNTYGGRYYEPAPGRTWRAGFSLNF
ncbi:MAG TPA: hypothetical protein VK074_07210 [Fodinibius sp.]|nr:hypothetical protein [Fodinibius sp.]